jgi:polysaccharide pyruvyl transferase WcaK-like protein
MRGRSGPAAIGVLGHYGNSNLGDEAIIRSVIDEIRRRLPDAVVYGISNNPADTATRYNLPSISVRTGELREPAASAVPSVTTAAGPRRGAERPAVGADAPRSALRALRHLVGEVIRTGAAIAIEAGRWWRCYSRLRRLDLLLVTGSNQMVDNFGGAWGFPYVNLRWSLLARLAGCPVAWVSVGAGPLDASLSQRFVRMSLRLAAYVSVRDEGSRKLLTDIGVERSCRLFPDLAHGLQLDRGTAPVPPATRPSGRRPLVGINPMPVYDERYWPDRSPEKYGRYVGELAALAAGLIDAGYGVFLFGTHPKDELVANDVLAEMAAKHGHRLAAGEVVRTSRRIEELLEVIESADVIVATRFHGTLLSLLSERPVLAICYYRKTRELMLEFDQGEDFAVAFDEFTAADALPRVRLLVDRAEELVSAMRLRTKECRAALADQYDLVLQLLADR